MAPSYLKLVRERSPREDSPANHFEQIQEPLLPVTGPTLAICTADGLSERLLHNLLDKVRPRLVLDFRTTPRFDFGTLNRGSALDLFESSHAVYRDVGRTLSGSVDSAPFIQDAISQIALPTGAVARNDSLLILIDAGLDFQRIGLSAVNTLREKSKVSWELLLFGRSEADAEEREVIFISHANPEDNEFAFWLQTQLTRAGYDTWSDLVDLKGGEVFWDTIEEVIRVRAIRVIAVLSRRAVTKPSVLDEISLAVSVERTRQLAGFLIPVRIDDLPFGEVRANIARKNILDFSRGWATGFSKLIESLRRDKVTRTRHTDGLSLNDWWTRQKPVTLSVTGEPEKLVSNRFRLLALPARIYAYSGIPLLREPKCIGLVKFAGLWLSFCSPSELAQAGIEGVTWMSTLSVPELFAGSISLTAGLSHSVRRKLKHQILNAQWESNLCALGLRLYEQTGLRPTPFVPDGLLPGNTAHFPNDFGKLTKRILVGFSTRRNVYWHFAPVGFFSSSGADTSLNLKTRILFSEDGHSRFPSTERLRTMRRSFCKNWWNDRWRSIQTAFIHWLADGEERVIVHKGEAGDLVLERDPIAFLAPLSIVEAHTQQKEGEFDDSESDENSLDDQLEDNPEADLASDELDVPHKYLGETSAP
jgi:hypothetical protein